MKCQEFESNVDGLARGALLDARTRDAAAAHEESCEACAARLADERALSAGLRALAASMREASAPARAEAALLSAFRSRAAAASAEAVGVAGAVSTSRAPSNPSNPSNVVSLSEHAGAKQLSWVRTVAVAAMAAAAAVALFMLVPPFLSTPSPARDSASKKTQGVPTQTRNNAPTTSAAGEQTASSSKGEDTTTQKLTDEDVAPAASTPRRNVVRGTNVSYSSPARRATNAGYGVAASNRGAVAADSRADEITTEFIPLVRDAAFAPSEGAHLVRVELPRSALASFGIPVNADRAGGRVKADVLLGEDGTARAIRFVR